MEFSKKLAVFISAVFAFVIILNAYTYLRGNRVSIDLLSAAGTPFAIVISGYYAKAGMENYTKIINGSENNEN